MFVAGAIVIGGGAAIVAGYDDHSRYRDHDNHSQYGDASVLEAIKKKKDQLQRQQREVASIRLRIAEEFRGDINQLCHEYAANSLKKAADSPCQYSKDKKLLMCELKNELKLQLEEGIAEEKEKLKQIDALIDKINRMEYMGKG